MTTSCKKCSYFFTRYRIEKKKKFTAKTPGGEKDYYFHEMDLFILQVLQRPCSLEQRRWPDAFS